MAPPDPQRVGQDEVATSTTGRCCQDIMTTPSHCQPPPSSSSLVTILGIGSLLSEHSARSTFPNLSNFRLGRVPNYRRVFAHPGSIFFRRGIVTRVSMTFASISAEPWPDQPGFVCSVFEVPQENDGDDDDDDDDINDSQGPLPPGIPSRAFLEREDNFELLQVPFWELDMNGTPLQQDDEATTTDHSKRGVLCVRSTDEAYIRQWGHERFERYYGQFGLHTIWNWQPDSGLLPCAIYLRHCVLAAQSMGPICYQSLLDETYLVDRSTTVRKYLEQHPDVMTTLPPPELLSKYSG